MAWLSALTQRIDSRGLRALPRVNDARGVSCPRQVPLEEVLALAAAAESGSEHPLASAVLDHAAAVFGMSDLSLSRSSPSLAADRFNQGL